MATTLSAKLNVDNAFELYISSNESVLGTLYLSGNSWPTTYTIDTIPVTGSLAYLQVVATDQGAPAAFLGEFTLSDEEYRFSNGTQHLLTNTADWTVRQGSFGDAGQSPVSRGVNGASPWGTRSVSSSAEWIWSSDLCGSCTRYFSTPIMQAVPEPATYGMMLAGLIGVAVMARRRKAVL